MAVADRPLPPTPTGRPWRRHGLRVVMLVAALVVVLVDLVH